MAVSFYDNLPINQDIVLDWPLTEGEPQLVHDQSKSGIVGVMNGTNPIIWAAANGYDYHGVFFVEAWQQFIEALAADTTDLNFTTTDYALAMWCGFIDTATDQILMSKYELNNSGWEVYHTSVGALRYMTVRHHHGGTRTGSYSLGWDFLTTYLFGVDRIGTAHQHYRDGVAIPTVSQVLQDPGSSIADNFRIGCRFTEDANWMNGYGGRPRAWSRAIGAAGHRQLFAQGYRQ